MLCRVHIPTLFLPVFVGFWCINAGTSLRTCFLEGPLPSRTYRLVFRHFRPSQADSTLDASGPS